MTGPRVLIVGAGPAGMFCADELLKSGITDVTILDSGGRMVRRVCPEIRACQCAVCDVIEGEGGAGGFSDGKLPYSLTRGTQLEQIFDPSCEPILREIDETVVRFGGPGVWYDPISSEPSEFEGSPLKFTSYPLRHVGTDGIREFTSRMGADLIARGLNLRTFTNAIRILIGRDGLTQGVASSRGGQASDWMSDILVIATGIQGITWMEKQMSQQGISLESGPAGIGIRIETRAEVLESLFERFYDWKLIYDHDGMILRSFCCNRQGYVVNQYHRELEIRNVNGHSSLDPVKRSRSSNFAIIAKIDDRICEDPQQYVREVARSINKEADGHSIVQSLSRFMSGSHSIREDINPLVRTNLLARYGADIGGAMPRDLYHAFFDFIHELYKVVPGVQGPDSLVYAPEMKYHGKRIPVDFDTWRSRDIGNMYVLGDASGYLDSFVAAALTGVIAGRDISCR